MKQITEWLRAMKKSLGLLALIGSGLVSVGLGGCAGGGAGTDTRSGAMDARAMYVMVYIQSGPKSGEGTQEAREAMFRGHMQHNHRLAEEKHLLIAGPFGKPHDKAWRGLFVMDVENVDRAIELASTDPGVVAGEFALRGERLEASKDLRKTLDLEAEQSAERAKMKEGLPPAVRPYVIVHARDIERARGAVVKTLGEARIVWLGRFADERPRGVMVLNAEEAAEVERALSEGGAGEVTVDGWFSTASLVKLPAGAGR
jgi:uncharacterized protein YciI